MKKFNKLRLVQRICSLIRQDSYTVSQICQKVGISESSFYSWQANDSDFAAQISAARRDYTENMIVECVRSLMKRIKGYDSTEVRTVYRPGKDGQKRVKEIIHQTKHIPPCLPAIIFVLTNKDPEHWKNTFTIQLENRRKIKIGKTAPYSGARILSLAEITVLNDTELGQKVKELQRKFNECNQTKAENEQNETS